MSGYIPCRKTAKNYVIIGRAFVLVSLYVQVFKRKDGGSLKPAVNAFQLIKHPFRRTSCGEVIVRSKQFQFGCIFGRFPVIWSEYGDMHSYTVQNARVCCVRMVWTVISRGWAQLILSCIICWVWISQTLIMCMCLSLHLPTPPGPHLSQPRFTPLYTHWKSLLGFLSCRE